MRIASRTSVAWLVAAASITTVALLAGRSVHRAPPFAMTEMTPRLQLVEHDLAKVSAEQRARAARAELAAIERDLDAKIDRLQVAADAEVAATSDRERASAHEALLRIEREDHDRAQVEQDRSDELRSQLGE